MDSVVARRRVLALSAAAGASIGIVVLVRWYRRRHRKHAGTVRIPDIGMDWTLSPAKISQHSSDLIARARALDDEIASLPLATATFEVTFGKMISQSIQDGPIESAVEYPMEVHPDKAIREASEVAEKAMSQAAVESSMRQDVYQVLKAVYDREKNNRTREEQRYMMKTCQAYEQNGMALDDKTRGEVEAIKKQLSDLATTFRRNISECKSRTLFTAAELSGCPPDFIQGLKEEDGKKVITTAYPDVLPVLKKCEVAATRDAVERMFNSRCIDENVKILEDVCALRHQVANKLGHATHGHYRLETRMAKNPEKVKEFLSTLAKKLAPLAERELQALRDLKRSETGDDSPISMGERLYYLNKIEELQYSVNHEALREYFPFETVMKGMLSIYTETFGLCFREIKNSVRWHEDVLLFAVFDDASRLLGYFYLDLWPRENKYSHAACWPLQPACTMPDGTRRPAVTSLVCNFSPAANGKPALLDHGEVVTFFHEFGHGVHNLCSKASLPRFAGTATERDFVEAPSQMLENWCWEKVSLKKMSKHYITGEPIPEDLLENLIKSRDANVGLLSCRQLTFGLFDQTIHSQPNPNTKEILIALFRDVMRFPMSEGTNFSASFGHMMGYDSQYYGYMWSQVFSDDMFFTRFKANPMSRAAGRAYCESILARGGSMDGYDMLEEFLGRPPNQDAFLKAKGIV